jgi:hypothetical protein
MNFDNSNAAADGFYAGVKIMSSYMWDEIKLLRYHNLKVRLEGSNYELQLDRN